MSRTKPEGVLKIEANGHVLTGRRRKGVWKVTCPDFPDLEGRYTEFRAFIGPFLIRSAAAEIIVSPVTDRG